MKNLVLVITMLVSTCSAVPSYAGTFKVTQEEVLDQYTIPKDACVLEKEMRDLADRTAKIKTVQKYDRGILIGTTGAVAAGVVHPALIALNLIARIPFTSSGAEEQKLRMYSQALVTLPPCETTSTEE